MSKIFELFGYPLTDKSERAERSRRQAMCPFMGLECDGGGNRPQSNLELKNRPELAAYFEDSGLSVIPSGVCSLQPGEGQIPWIVCPRRLLFLGKRETGSVSQRANQEFAEQLLFHYAEFPTGTGVGVWPEVKMKYTSDDEQDERTFDYTFDYIVMSLDDVPESVIQEATQYSRKKLRTVLEAAGYELVFQDDGYYVKDYPAGPPVIVEIMTSSTSGGNKRKRTTIPMAFEDAILGKSHTGPGINYRQVWARMVSQLIVKSEVGLAWGGKTIWVLQDRLVNYISRSTALNMYDFLSDETSEVNILSFRYDVDNFMSGSGVINLDQGELYAGPIQSGTAEDLSGFQDIIRTAIKPPLSALSRLLAARKPSTTLSV